jgi:hypothetical protein
MHDFYVARSMIREGARSLWLFSRLYKAVTVRTAYYTGMNS